MTKKKIETGNQRPGLPKDGTVSDEVFRSADEEQRGEGSVGYRIAAMVAMFLLALAGMLFWYFGR
jgi:hypothetical protein